MGYLSKYTRTERIDLGDGFWVDIRPHLTAAQKAAAEDRLVANNDGALQVGTGAYSLELAVQAITDWNLTDDADKALPVNPVEARRASVALLPAEAVEAVNAAVNSAAKKAREAEADLKSGGAEVAVGQEPASPVAAL